MRTSTTRKNGEIGDRRSFLADKLRSLNIPRAGSVKPVGPPNPSDRAVRLKSRELIDVSAFANELGFTAPVALSCEVWAGLVEIDHDLPALKRRPRMRERRILDILLEAMKAAKREPRSKEVRFCVHRLTSKAERDVSGKVAVKSELTVRCEPGDFGEPVVTISLASPASCREDEVAPRAERGGKRIASRKRAAQGDQ